ncbi:MAG: branched-chain amino acid ABC transporter permease [Anaerolineae bacterium]|nr:branched-chain amino acid ABC transporter permease [Anaerolineae bacterium]NUQ07039.1 branched-chain amino acid ABC transporter permease [Anaerolineae bacterium]
MDILRSIGITEPVIQFMLVNAILGLSIYLTLYTGMFSLANAGFMAVGAFTGVILTQEAGLPLGIGVLGGMALAGLVAIPIGLPVLRLHDIYLAIATIGFGEVVRILILNFDPLMSSLTGQTVALTGGALGIKGIPKIAETWHLLLFLGIAVYCIARLHRSRFGRAMAAVRQDERVAANMGVNVVYVKNLVFVLSAILAGGAGALSGHLTRIISPDGYGFDQAVQILAFAVLGGTGSIAGPIVGGIVLTGLPEVLRFASQYRGVINGLVLLLMIVYVPGGLVNPAGWARLWRRLRGPTPDS